MSQIQDIYQQIKNESILQLAFYSLLLAFVFGSLFFAVSSGVAWQFVAFDRLKMLTWASIGLFFAISLAGVMDRRLYYLFLVFMLLAFPSPINDIMPGIMPGPSNERDTAPFPFFTHIDLYLLLGIFLNCYHNRFKLKLFHSWVLAIGIGTLFVPSLFNLFISPNLVEASLVVFGLFQLRYLLLIILLVITQDIRPYYRQILTGLVFSIAFLMLEALVNTKLSGAERLESGTLSLNTFGNIVAASLVCMWLLWRKTRFNPFLLIGGMLLSLIIVLLTQNRMSLLAIPVAFILYYFISQRGFVNNARSVIVILMVVGLGFFLFPKIERLLPERFALSEIVARTNFNSSAGLLDVEQSKETSTFFTRMLLLRTSANMISEHPIVGIGPGRWNYYKQDYGFPEAVLIDSHNGLAALLSQYGLFSIIFGFVIYLYPVFILLKNRKLRKEPLAYLALINMTMLICDLTNAGIFKYQVFAFLAFNLVVLVAPKNQIFEDAEEPPKPALQA